jgi:trimethylamine--corrinoid protein Co-methyltransferase
LVDAQSGYEKTITGILPALAGANVIYGLGMLEMGITFDLAQLVLDHEIAEMILYSLRGVPVNDETLAVNVIKELGIGMDYLSHRTTFDHYQRAQDKVKDILETYVPPPLGDDELATIRSIIVEAEKELGVYK